MPVYKTSNPRKRVKSRAGCRTCKQRRLKCDEKLPSCSRCEKRGLSCPGYTRNVKWSDKYERWLPGEKDQDHTSSKSHADWFIQEAGKLEAAIAGRADGYTATQSGSSAVDITDSDDPTHSSITESYLPCEGRWTTSPPLSPVLHGYLEPLTDRLLRYYFSRVCGILSAFDSRQNPFRSLVQELMPTHPALLHCVLGMSAAHLHQKERGQTRSLRHRAQALSELGSNITQVIHAEKAVAPPSSSTTALLLTAIMLGMTSTWHDVSSLDLVHLQGARALFRQWNGPALCDPHCSFLVGVMAFWESLASFHVDQDVESVDYLFDVCGNTTSLGACVPNPLTGVCTVLFIYMAKVGALSRQLRHFDRLWGISSAHASNGDSYAPLLEKARAIELLVRSYSPPPLQCILETADDHTPPVHLHTMSQVYRLTILLELYRLFPGLLGPPACQTAADPGLSHSSHLLVSLAIEILTLLLSLGESTGTKAIQLLPWIIAGSALQNCVASPSPLTPFPLSCGSYASIMSICHSSMTIHYWRTVVRERIRSLHRYVGLDSVGYATRLVERVWRRADHRVGAADTTRRLVGWTEVMLEENLQTFFG
ncbi:Zn(II)2Cys6 transcription factor [Aspergillus aculeatinus CBS 121060]|uniref:Uncharacterized protein n=1 Tax=Aspergillus aculeatinus CBS 121060 TaxID=1448322 RepID=A0ACD1GVI2_9EURO|nr:hypothetical protein BO66DRAFT_214871 [Aspergillus aculeatinus CBS 121060]RAH65207.1 hypothetical protein BO66DRAFT_214871 [Aspergillus aculeatinus CBS 121060]